MKCAEIVAFAVCVAIILLLHTVSCIILYVLRDQQVLLSFMNLLATILYFVKQCLE